MISWLHFLKFRPWIRGVFFWGVRGLEWLLIYFWELANFQIMILHSRFGYRIRDEFDSLNLFLHVITLVDSDRNHDFWGASFFRFEVIYWDNLPPFTSTALEIQICASNNWMNLKVPLLILCNFVWDIHLVDLVTLHDRLQRTELCLAGGFPTVEIIITLLGLRSKLVNCWFHTGNELLFQFQYEKGDQSFHQKPELITNFLEAQADIRGDKPGFQMRQRIS